MSMVFPICDQFYENVPKVAKTSAQIWLKVANNLKKYLKIIFSYTLSYFYLCTTLQ